MGRAAPHVAIGRSQHVAVAAPVSGSGMLGVQGAGSERASRINDIARVWRYRPSIRAVVAWIGWSGFRVWLWVDCAMGPSVYKGVWVRRCAINIISRVLLLQASVNIAVGKSRVAGYIAWQ
jgi:hypothetical protein